MSDLDYYSYAPLVRPDRPVCIVGLPGSRAETTARLLSTFTGLPLFNLDRAVEHKAGTSIDGIVLKQGEPERRRWEHALLPPVLRRKTPHIVALGDTTLHDGELAGLIRATSTLVVLRRPAIDLLAEILRQHQKDRTRFARYTLGEVPDGKTLGPALVALEKPYLPADHVVELGDQHPRLAAQDLVTTLGWTLPTLS